MNDASNKVGLPEGAAHVSLPLVLRLRGWLTLVGLWFEHLWSALWPATGLMGAYFALSLFDFWSYVPGIVQGVFFLVAVLGSFWSLVVNLRHRIAVHGWPTFEKALRRIEGQSALPHRPLSAIDDTLIDASQDPDTRRLWEVHQARQRARLLEARAALPHSDLPERDPYALRIGVALLLIISSIFAGPDWMNRVGVGLNPAFGFSIGGQASLTAWVNPPSYTRMAPIFLDGATSSKDTLISVPENSELMLRINEARGTPVLRRPSGLSRVTALQGPQETDQITSVLTQSGTYTLKDRGRTLGNWRFAVTPDAAPYAGFETMPKATPDNTLGFRYMLQDDYGLAWARLHLVFEGPVGVEVEKQTALSEAFDVNLPLPGTGAKSIAELASLDLTQHPFAGLPVTAQIVVEDLAGQSGRSDIVHVTLPERDFFEPLALAIVEQRRNLVRDPTDWAYVMRAIEALTFAPERFLDDLTVYVGLRTAYWQLDRVMPVEREEIMPTIELLWDLAIHIEDGNLSQAERELKAIAKALMEALARGAPMDEIQRLLQRYKQALERYLAALAEQMGQDGQSAEQQPGDGTSVTDQDLQDLLKSIEDLARTGDQAAARDMLAQLQKMLENMTMSQGNGGGMNGPESEMQRQIEGLSDLIGKERALMDETMRRAQEEGADGEAAPSPEGQDGLPGLADQQSDLRGELGEARPNMPGEGDVAGALEDAEEAMRDAEEALGENNGRGALHAQKRAIESMREAAEGLAEQLMQSMQARGAQGAGETDPMGRPEGSSGNNLGDHIKVPEERDLQRAREILEELQRRASDPNRPELELDYLERLLKQFGN